VDDPLRRKFLDREQYGGRAHGEVLKGGLRVGYCVFCAHGHGEGAPQGLPLMREDNTLLLSKFLAPDGRILPRRFTGVCPKHQRKLARTIKRSQAMSLMPYQSKLNPRIRFTSLTPDPVSRFARLSIICVPNVSLQLTEPVHGAPATPAATATSSSSPAASAQLDAALDELQGMMEDAPDARA
jgi:ribosomal protein S18